VSFNTFFKIGFAISTTALLFSIPCSGHAQSYPPAYSAASHYAIGDLAQTGGNVYRAIKAVTGGSGPLFDYTDWQLESVKTNTTLLIGASQVFPTLTAAWNYCLNARVADGVYLHLYISTANGNYTQTFSSPFLLDHGSGPRMAILGDNQANIQLNCAPDVTGFIVDTGHSFNTLSGLTLNGGSGSGDGIKADFDATISSIGNTNIFSFNNGIHAQQGASVLVGAGCTLFACSSAACLAETSASVVFSQGITLTGGGANGQESGFMAKTGGEVIAENSTLSTFSVGAQALLGGIVDINGSSVSNCNAGAFATNGGILTAESSTIEACSTGVSSTEHGFLQASYATITGNNVGCLADERGFLVADSGSLKGNSTLDLQVATGGFIEATPGTYTNINVSSNDEGAYISD
jgi:hypothetical protein